MKNIKQILIVLIIVAVSYFTYEYLLESALIKWNELNPQYKINKN